MPAIELVIIAALAAYAVYKQTKVQLVSGRGRFRLAAIYLVVGVVLGIARPHNLTAFGLLAASLVVSLAVGAARGACTRVWREGDGRVRSRGSATTIWLFLALLASKFVIGAVGERLGIHDSSTGEILAMIAVSVAVQAEIVWRRARLLDVNPQATWTGSVVAAGSTARCRCR